MLFKLGLNLNSIEIISKMGFEVLSHRGYNPEQKNVCLSYLSGQVDVYPGERTRTNILHELTGRGVNPNQKVVYPGLYLE